MNRTSSKVMAMALALLLSICGLGCASFTGAVIGGAIDSRKPDRQPVEMSQAGRVKPGTKVWIGFKDSTKAEGKYGGITLVNHDQLVAQYSRFCSRDSISGILPALGDSIRVLPKKGHWLCGRLTDFYWDQSKTDPDFAFTVERSDTNLLQRWRIDQINGLRRSMEPIASGQQLSQWLSGQSGLQPYASLAMVIDSGTRQIPCDSVAVLTVPIHRHGQLTGFLIGAVVDAAAWAMAVALHDSMSWGK